MAENMGPNARNWIFDMHESLSHASFTCMVVILWSIWYARRKAIYEGIFQSPQQTISFVNTYLRELGQIALKSPKIPSVRASSPGPQWWIAPPAGPMKVNVDGAVLANRQGGAATAVCRDGAGNYLGSSAIVLLGTHDLTILKTLACREGLTLAEDLGIQQLVVAWDCSGVVKDINEGTGGPHAAIVHEIQARSTSFSCSFLHEHRNCNFEVYNLAKYACNLGVGRHVWLGNPHDPSFVPMNILQH
ncbi:hypothetical protein ZWY2020_048732 [Hordeum vulgare]|nr:hypothetical protein ZWY2020_048732 [Hordeum vulgare]